jgi:hypothetical protein
VLGQLSLYNSVGSFLSPPRERLRLVGGTRVASFTRSKHLECKEDLNLENGEGNLKKESSEESKTVLDSEIYKED